MNDKLKELTDKVYQEGIEKAKKDSEEILSLAHKEADGILKAAREEANALKKLAEKEANEFKKNVSAELSLSSKQILDKLRQDIQSLLESKVVNKDVDQVLSSNDAVAEIITKISANLKADNSGGVRIHLNAEDEKSISESLKNRLKSEFDKGLAIYPDKSLNLGFKIGPDQGNYLISFTDDDFKNILNSFLRKETQSFLEKNANE